MNNEEIKMKKSFTIGICFAFSVMLSGCNDLVLTNVVAGLRDGAITTTTGIINTLFDQRFSVAPATEGEEGGDDLFVRL